MNKIVTISREFGSGGARWAGAWRRWLNALSRVRAATASMAGLSSYGVGRETRAARRFAHAERVAASMMPGKALAA